MTSIGDLVAPQEQIKVLKLKVRKYIQYVMRALQSLDSMHYLPHGGLAWVCWRGEDGLQLLLPSSASMTVSLGLRSAMLLPSLMRNLRVWQHPTRSHARTMLCMAVGIGIGRHWPRHPWLPASYNWLQHIRRPFMLSLFKVDMAL